MSDLAAPIPAEGPLEPADLERLHQAILAAYPDADDLEILLSHKWGVRLSARRRVEAGDKATPRIATLKYDFEQTSAPPATSTRGASSDPLWGTVVRSMSPPLVQP